MPTIKLLISYYGTDYSGWQRQENGISIQQLLEEALQKLTGESVVMMSSGRTDAGVHALEQVVAFRCEKILPMTAYVLGLNTLLPKAIMVRSAKRVADDFHPQFSAKSKIYTYVICDGSGRHPFWDDRAWFVLPRLNLSAMRRAARCLVGEHDFSAFCAAGSPVKDKRRTIMRCTISAKPLRQQWHARGESSRLIEISVEGSGFLRHMVRNIAGLLVDIGKGRFPPERMQHALHSRDRKQAGMCAPACGLYLKKVKY